MPYKKGSYLVTPCIYSRSENLITRGSAKEEMIIMRAVLQFDFRQGFVFLTNTTFS
jgi:hypothetical protein